jgi:outer membrane murein-binding lipoprotein Lpp
MRQVLTLVAVGVLGLSGCSNEGGSSTGTTEASAPAPTLTSEQKAKVDKAVAVHAALQAGQDPDAALRAQGLTEQQFDDLMYEIAADEAMSAAYAARTGP